MRRFNGEFDLRQIETGGAAPEIVFTLFDGIGTADMAVAGGNGTVFVEDAAQNSAESFSFVTHGAADEILHFQRAAGRAAGSFNGTDVENSALDLSLYGVGADVRQGLERFDDKDNVTFAPDDRTFNGEVDGRFNVAVQKIADGRWIETSGFFGADPVYKLGLPNWSSPTPMTR